MDNGVVPSGCQIIVKSLDIDHRAYTTSPYINGQIGHIRAVI